ncbi:hypothetical protein H310_13025 [Aphanomyces invadans]|uniref:Uncharacterized protein n=1 Tax=Aphanomyces invadans TaxID=157072 RepID=A0A024TGV4_9STRA|nr:hypothetical protein H310_13025 [Aphanomyces invadans]ETV92811.1 hypothetical protein H310_13025 [Aphanomyces invadans]|eukprot:XP_008878581.1 hypothetical protein H310_13025 [Aphanomyces invadans]
MLKSVAMMTMVAADGRGFARYKDRMRRSDPSWVLIVGPVDRCEGETILEYITVFVYSLLRPNAGRQRKRRVGWPTTVGTLVGSLVNFALTRRSFCGPLASPTHGSFMSNPFACAHPFHCVLYS